MKKILALLFVLLAFTAIAQPPVLRTYYTTNSDIIVSNAIKGMATNAALGVIAQSNAYNGTFIGDGLSLSNVGVVVSGNVRLGNQALSAPGAALTNNVAIGDQALMNLMGPWADNIGIGKNAGRNATNILTDIFIGTSAAISAVTGGGSTIIGHHAGMYLFQPNLDIALGSRALEGGDEAFPPSVALNTSSQNTAVGIGALQMMQTGTHNIALGFLSGYGTLTNHWSVADQYMMFLGDHASRDASITNSTALSNSVAIGRNATVADSGVMALGGTGANALKVGIGTNAAFAALDVQNPAPSLALRVGAGGSADAFSIASNGVAQFAFGMAGHGGGLTNLDVSTATGVLPIGTVATQYQAAAGPFISTNAGLRGYSYNAGSLTNLPAAQVTGTFPGLASSNGPVAIWLNQSNSQTFDVGYTNNPTPALRVTKNSTGSSGRVTLFGHAGVDSGLGTPYLDCYSISFRGGNAGIANPGVVDILQLSTYSGGQQDRIIITNINTHVKSNLTVWGHSTNLGNAQINGTVAGSNVIASAVGSTSSFGFIGNGAGLTNVPQTVSIKTTFFTNYQVIGTDSFFCLRGTNQVITLPDASAAGISGKEFHFSSTNGNGSFILTNKTGAQTIRDGTSLSLKQVGIGEIGVVSDGANWWLASKFRTIFPNAQFSTSTNIPLTSANVAYPITFNSTDYNNSQGISLVNGTNGLASKIRIVNPGQYQFAPSLITQFGGNNYVRFWFRSNDTNITATTSVLRGAAGGTSVRLATVVVTLNVSEQTDFEIWAMSDATSQLFLAEAAAGTPPNDYPACPSVICTVVRVSDPYP